MDFLYSKYSKIAYEYFIFGTSAAFISFFLFFNIQIFAVTLFLFIHFVVGYVYMSYHRYLNTVINVLISTAIISYLSALVISIRSSVSDTIIDFLSMLSGKQSLVLFLFLFIFLIIWILQKCVEYKVIRSNMATIFFVCSVVGLPIIFALIMDTYEDVIVGFVSTYIIGFIPLAWANYLLNNFFKYLKTNKNISF